MPLYPDFPTPAIPTADVPLEKLSLDDPKSRRKLYRIIPRPPPRSAGLFRIIPRVAGPTNPHIPTLSFRPQATTPVRVEDIGARTLHTSSSRRSTFPTTPRVKAKVEEEERSDGLEPESPDPDPPILAKPSEPVILHPGHPAVTLDASRATSAPITAPHALSAPLPLFDYRVPLPGHMSTPPSVIYTSSPAEADDLLSCLRGDVLGLDLEWPPPGQGPVRTRTGRDGTEVSYRDGVWDPVQKKYFWPQGRTAVIQVCDGHTAILLHLLDNASPGPGLVALLADRTRLKVGVAIRGDALKLVRDFPECAARPPGGLLELGRLARAIEPQRWKSRASLVALAKLTQGYLGRDLDKTGVRIGAWDTPLTQEQIDYAANDVVVSHLLYKAIMERAGALGMSVDARELVQNVSRPHGEVKRKEPKESREPKARSEPLHGTMRNSGADAGYSRLEARTYDDFVDGREVSELALSLGVKENVILSQILSVAESAPPDSLDLAVRQRILGNVTRGSWVATKHYACLLKLRKSIEGGQDAGL